MKTTGMVRRIDELGRIVLPKELRQTLNKVSHLHWKMRRLF